MGLMNLRPDMLKEEGKCLYYEAKAQIAYAKRMSKLKGLLASNTLKVAQPKSIAGPGNFLLNAYKIYAENLSFRDSILVSVLERGTSLPNEIRSQKSKI